VLFKITDNLPDLSRRVYEEELRPRRPRPCRRCGVGQDCVLSLLFTYPVGVRNVGLGRKANAVGRALWTQTMSVAWECAGFPDVIQAQHLFQQALDTHAHPTVRRHPVPERFKVAFELPRV